MSEIMAFSMQQKANFVTMYDESGSITQTQNTYCTKRGASLPSSNSIVSSVQNFRKHENEGIIQQARRRSRKSENVRIVSG